VRRWTRRRRSSPPPTLQGGEAACPHAGHTGVCDEDWRGVRPGGPLPRGRLYGSDAEFRALIVPFVEEGAAAGEPVIIGYDGRKSALLRSWLADPSAVEFIGDKGLYATPARAIATYRRLFEISRRHGRRADPDCRGCAPAGQRAASTAYGFRTPSVFEPVNSASAAGRHPALSAVRTAGASLARWAVVSRQVSPSAAKNSLTGPPPPISSAASRASSTRAEAADGSMDGSLYGSGATPAPRSCAGCTPSACRLHPVGRVIHSLAGGGNGVR